MQAGLKRRRGQAVGQIQVIGGQQPTIGERGGEFDEAPRGLDARGQFDMHRQSADTLLGLAQQPQPDGCTLDEFVAAEVAVTDEALGGQGFGGVGEFEPGGVGQIDILEGEEPRPQRLPDPQQGQRRADQQLQQQGRRSDRPFQHPDQQDHRIGRQQDDRAQQGQQWVAHGRFSRAQSPSSNGPRRK
ncbi:MAG: hypothetical protein EA420_07690 [Candidatus Competibacteraceae bacterium]|nr:MAG: hypothetical protein EA420_07690 [Candidatus Competibacteraceae bacterium]